MSQISCLPAADESSGKTSPTTRRRELVFAHKNDNDKPDVFILERNKVIQKEHDYLFNDRIPELQIFLKHELHSFCKDHGIEEWFCYVDSKNPFCFELNELTGTNQSCHVKMFDFYLELVHSKWCNDWTSLHTSAATNKKLKTKLEQEMTNRKARRIFHPLFVILFAEFMNYCQNHGLFEAIPGDDNNIAKLKVHFARQVLYCMLSKRVKPKHVQAGAMRVFPLATTDKDKPPFLMVKYVINSYQDSYSNEYLTTYPNSVGKNGRSKAYNRNDKLSKEAFTLQKLIQAGLSTITSTHTKSLFWENVWIEKLLSEGKMAPGTSERKAFDCIAGELKRLHHSGPNFHDQDSILFSNKLRSKLLRKSKVVNVQRNPLYQSCNALNVQITHSESTQLTDSPKGDDLPKSTNETNSCAVMSSSESIQTGQTRCGVLRLLVSELSAHEVNRLKSGQKCRLEAKFTSDAQIEETDAKDEIWTVEICCKKTNSLATEKNGHNSENSTSITRNFCGNKRSFDETHTHTTSYDVGLPPKKHPRLRKNKFCKPDCLQPCRSTVSTSQNEENVVTCLNSTSCAGCQITQLGVATDRSVPFEQIRSQNGSDSADLHANSSQPVGRDVSARQDNAVNSAYVQNLQHQPRPRMSKMSLGGISSVNGSKHWPCLASMAPVSNLNANNMSIGTAGVNCDLGLTANVSNGSLGSLPSGLSNANITGRKYETLRSLVNTCGNRWNMDTVSSCGSSNMYNFGHVHVGRHACPEHNQHVHMTSATANDDGDIYSCMVSGLNGTHMAPAASLNRAFSADGGQRFRDTIDDSLSVRDNVGGVLNAIGSSKHTLPSLTLQRFGSSKNYSNRDFDDDAANLLENDTYM